MGWKAAVTVNTSLREWLPPVNNSPVAAFSGVCFRYLCGRDADAVSANSDEKRGNSLPVLSEHLSCSSRWYRLTVTGLRTFLLFLTGGFSAKNGKRGTLTRRPLACNNTFFKNIFSFSRLCFARIFLFKSTRLVVKNVDRIQNHVQSETNAPRYQGKAILLS